MVDLNSEKQGKFMPPYGQEVVASERLKDINPGTIIVASKKFIDEVRLRTPACSKVVALEELPNFIN